MIKQKTYSYSGKDSDGNSIASALKNESEIKKVLLNKENKLKENRSDLITSNRY